MITPIHFQIYTERKTQQLWRAGRKWGTSARAIKKYHFTISSLYKINTPLYPQETILYLSAVKWQEWSVVCLQSVCVLYYTLDFPKTKNSNQSKHPPNTMPLKNQTKYLKNKKKNPTKKPQRKTKNPKQNNNTKTKKRPTKTSIKINVHGFHNTIYIKYTHRHMGIYFFHSSFWECDQKKSMQFCKSQKLLICNSTNKLSSILHTFSSSTSEWEHISAFEMELIRQCLFF